MGNNSSTATSSPKGLTSELHKTPPTSTSAIALLLSRGVDPYAHYAPTPLIAAVTSGCMPTIQLLTAHGALTNCPGHGPPSTTAPPYGRRQGRQLRAAAAEASEAELRDMSGAIALAAYSGAAEEI